jgi:hypothetical protein
MLNNMKVTRANEGDSASGKITFVAPRGCLVQIDGTASAGLPAAHDPGLTWKKANGTRAYVLERDVIQGPLPLDQIMFDKAIGTPDTLRPDGGSGYEGWVSARKIEEAEFEGPDLIDASITGSTAVGAALSTKAGKLSLQGEVAAGDEVVGYLRAHLAPLEAGQVRILVEFVQ